ncbi:MAG: hypothetical protein ABEJ77_02330 [Halanaeroarchaeum sp.]
MESLAAQTREAVDAHPFVRDALRAEVLNFAAAARYLDVEGGQEAIATALRRYAAELPPIQSRDGAVRVTMRRGIDPDEPILAVGDRLPAASSTAVLAVGDVDARLAATVADRLAASDVGIEGLGLVGDGLIAVVERGGGRVALDAVEDAAARYR